MNTSHLFMSALANLVSMGVTAYAQAATEDDLKEARSVAHTPQIFYRSKASTPFIARLGRRLRQPCCCYTALPHRRTCSAI